MRSPRGLLVPLLGRLHALAVEPARVALAAAARRPAEVQGARLRDLVRALGGTAYGRAVGLPRVTSLADFRARVPIVRYDDLGPWIERVAAGEPRVLTPEPVLAFERSGGSTAPTKWIPLTAGLLAEFGAATGAWLGDLYRALPGLRGGRSYWSVSPVAEPPQTTAGGLRVGLADDTEYFDPLTRRALRHLLAVPPEVGRLTDLEAWRRATCRALLAADDLVLISVWSPTFLTRLMEALERDLPGLLAGLPARRRAAIEAGLAREGVLSARTLWPGLQLVSCWADGTSAAYLAALGRWFEGIPIQPKGLLATEGVVSVPVWGHEGAALAVTGHHLDFLDLQAPRRVVSAHELRVGGAYSPLLTTSGGLVRYHLPDALACVGHLHGLPLVSFRGKLDRVSDLAGEKLNAHHVEAALQAARDATGLAWSFALVAPAPLEPPAYTLYVECEAPTDALQRLRDALEAALEQSHPYRYARRLGQLGPLRVRRIRGGLAAYEREVLARGQRLGDAKPPALDTADVWERLLPTGER